MLAIIKRRQSANAENPNENGFTDDVFHRKFMSDKIENLLAEAEAQANSASDATSSVACAERRFASASEAAGELAKFKKKLCRIEKWNADSGLSSFELFDENGEKRTRESARVGDFVRVTLTGSGKSDWVKITRIDEAPDEMILTLQPSYNPTEEAPDKTVTSHFFTAESTNNFCLQRRSATVIFRVVGIDEKTNTQNTNNIIETVRNAATANLGHYLGIQEGEWKLFCENFLQ